MLFDIHYIRENQRISPRIQCQSRHAASSPYVSGLTVNSHRLYGSFHISRKSGGFDEDGFDEDIV
jgi:hypothetical protein